MGLHISISPDASELVSALARQLRQEMAAGRIGVFAPARVLVPHRNLSRWLTLRLADAIGVAANLEFPFLEQGLWQLLTEADPAVEKPVRLDSDALQRLLFSHFFTGSLYDSPELEPVRAYLAVAKDAAEWPPDAMRRAWQLADRLARLFLEYECQRPEMIRAWNADQPWTAPECDAATQEWQRRLYREMFRPEGWRDRTLPGRLSLPQYRARLALPDAVDAAKPPVYLFGVGHTSSFHLDLLCDLGMGRDLHCFLCLPDTDAPHELLERWGKSARQMREMIAARQEARPHLTVQVIAAKPAPEPAPHLLATLQRELSTGEKGAQQEQDRSLQVWACPGAHREAETVHNLILAQLAADPTLRLTEIAVLVPDLDTYLPLLHAVFSRGEERIPYNLVDANAARASLYANAVTALLNLIGGAFTRKEVFALLSNPCYLAAVDADAEMARQWLAWADALGIFHGYDREGKCQACDGSAEEKCAACRDGQGRFDPEKLSDAHTWQAGLRRLRLGRIMEAPPELPEDGKVRSFAGHIPYADLATGDEAALDRFSYGVELLYRQCTALANGERRSCSEWGKALRALTDTLLAVPAEAPQEAHVRALFQRSLETLGELDACFPEGVSLSLARDHALGNLEEIPASRGRPLLDGVTITTPRQARLIPMRQIYLLGLGEGEFPGHAGRSTLDLRGDGGGESDLPLPDVNRQLFLDLLLAARDRLVLTYSCRDVEKDALLNPCSLITQLESYLEREILPPGARFVEAQAPLAERSLQYLGTQPARPHDPLVSYDRQARWMALADAAHNPALPEETRTAAGNLLQGYRSEKVEPLRLPEPPARAADAAPLRLSDLAAFLINPAEARLKRQLFLRDEEGDDAAEQEDEPFRSAFPVDQKLSRGVLERYVRYTLQKGEPPTDPAAFFRPFYEDARKRSLTPDGIYAHLDEAKWEKDFVSAAENDDFAALLAALPGGNAGAVSIGMPLRGARGTAFPALPVPVADATASVRTLLPYVWEADDSVQALIFTTSKRAADLNPKRGGGWKLIPHILEPLLTYLALQAGELPGPEGKDSHDWLADRPFTLHISYPAGVASATFRAAAEDAKAYLRMLATAYLQDTAFDDLPLAVIAGERALFPPPDGADAEAYAERLQNAIDDWAADSQRSRGRMELLSLLRDLRAPADALEKVRQRLLPLYCWRVLEGEQ